MINPTLDFFSPIPHPPLRLLLCVCFFFLLCTSAPVAFIPLSLCALCPFVLFSALCMVRALQVLSVPRFEEQQDKLKLLEVESLFFDGDSGDAQGRGELVAAGARAGGGDGGESHRCA